MVNAMALHFRNFVKSFFRLTSNFWLVTGLARPVNYSQPRPLDFKAGQRSFGSFLSVPAFYVFATVLSAALSILGSNYWSLAGLAGLVIWPALAVMHFELSGATWAEWSAQLRKIGSRM